MVQVNKLLSLNILSRFPGQCGEFYQLFIRNVLPPVIKSCESTNQARNISLLHVQNISSFPVEAFFLSLVPETFQSTFIFHLICLKNVDCLLLFFAQQESRKVKSEFYTFYHEIPSLQFGLDNRLNCSYGINFQLGYRDIANVPDRILK